MSQPNIKTDRLGCCFSFLYPFYIDTKLAIIKADLEILLETLEERTFADSLANLIALAIEGFERQRTQEALSKAKAQLEMTVGAPLNLPPPINCSASKLPTAKEPK